MKTIFLLLFLYFFSVQAHADNELYGLPPTDFPAALPESNTYQSTATPTVFTEIAAEEDQPPLDKMLSYAFSLLNTPYKYSGVSKNTGFDCSGFVSHVFSQALGIQLPHQARSIWTEGAKIDIQQLMPGDLVFYNTLRRKLSHVGIYLGNGQFIHSATHGGVRVDNMRTAYWQPRWNGARRIAEFNRSFSAER